MKKAIAVTLAALDAAATMAAGAVLGLLPRAHADGDDGAFIATPAKQGVSCANFDNCPGWSTRGWSLGVVTVRMT
jgi:hypothetical protein